MSCGIQFLFQTFDICQVLFLLSLYNFLTKYFAEIRILFLTMQEKEADIAGY